MAEKIIASTVAKFVEKIPFEILLGEDAEKGYTSASLILATLPHDKTEATQFVRRNGNYALKLQADEEVGLPYGRIPRLLLAWITTEAVRTKSRTLTLGKNLSEFLAALGIARQGGRITALYNQMERLFSTSFSFVYSDKERKSGKNLHVVSEYDLWFPSKSKDPKQRGLAESTITLTEEFYKSIIENPVVFYIDALKILKKSLEIDIYLWLTYKNSYAKGITAIPWASLQDQFGADYAKNPDGKKNFKRKFLAALKKVAAIYPEAKRLKDSPEGLLYVPGKPHVPKTKALQPKKR